MAPNVFRLSIQTWLCYVGVYQVRAFCCNRPPQEPIRLPLTPQPKLHALVDRDVEESRHISHVNRRSFLGISLGLFGTTVAPVKSAVAVNDDLTASLYNPDGSLREDVSSKALFRSISFRLPTSGDLVEAIDGKPTKGAATGSANSDRQVLVSYELPDKWTNDYTENGISACRKITVYKVDKGDPVLSKASKIGVPIALETSRIGLQQADLMSGSTRGDYYEFDLAVAPKTCESSSDNLGLGFCPYDDIYLLSATNVGDQIYVFCIEASKEEWKRSNADIRRVRRSLRIEEA